ncbi:MAG: hypothetical protein ACJ790_14350 [Myxococcaceae bacterium]
MANVKSPTGLVAPWWRDYNKAVANGKVTKAEVKSLVENHKDLFQDKLYRTALEKLADGTSKDAKATPSAKAELNKVLHPEPPHIWFPTRDQLQKTYTSIVEGREKAGELKHMDAAPKGVENAAVFDITPKGLLGSKREIVEVNNHLYLRTTAVVPNAKPSYFDAGPAPLF